VTVVRRFDRNSGMLRISPTELRICIAVKIRSRNFAWGWVEGEALEGKGVRGGSDKGNYLFFKPPKGERSLTLRLTCS